MASYGKNKSKNYSFKEENNPLFPISNKKKNLVNYYSALKLNNKIDLKKQSKNINVNPYNNIQYKKKIETSGLNNPKIKIKPLEFSSSANNSQILEKIVKETRSKKQLLLASNKTNNNFRMKTSRENINNKNISSPRNNFDKSQIININNINKNNLFNNRIQNIYKNFVEINDSNDKPYINNIIINNSSTNINLSQINNNSKININNIEINNQKESNIKLIFKKNNINSPKKLKIDNLDFPIVLKRKDNPLTSTSTNQKISENKIIFAGNYKILFKKQRNISDLNDILNNDNTNNFIKQEFNFNNEPKKKNSISGPENLHYYYISVIQKGKKKEIEFEKEIN